MAAGSAFWEADSSHRPLGMIRLDKRRLGRVRSEVDRTASTVRPRRSERMAAMAGSVLATRDNATARSDQPSRRTWAVWTRVPSQRNKSAMRSVLSRLYRFAGALAALFLVAIAVIVLISITSRLLGYAVPGLANYAGYCMAASSFLALAYTFEHGGHIRVSLLLQALGARNRRLAEIWCLAAGLFLAAYLAWFSVKMVRVSIAIGDISQGPDATPLWIPQLGMAIGTTILAIALLDRLIAVARGAPVEQDQTRVD